MERFIQDRKNFIRNVSIYFLITMICFIYVEKGKYYNIGNRCLSDMLCDALYYGKYIIYPFLMIILINFFKNDFRIAILLRYEKVLNMIKYLSFKSFLISMIISFGQTCLITVSGCINGMYKSNWRDASSYVRLALGVVMKKNIPTELIIALYFYITLLHVFLICMIICLLWWLTESPLPGFILVQVILIYEGTVSNGEILFNVISMEERKLVLGLLGVKELIFYPMLLIGGIYILMIAVIRKKDFVRFI